MEHHHHSDGRDLDIDLMETKATTTNLNRLTWVIEGIEREAYVSFPDIKINAPIVFALHGHGGKAIGFSDKQHFETYWKQAVVVYPQGLPTKSGGDQQANYTGWQHSVGERNTHTGIKDQDVKFFDAMLEKFIEFGISQDLVFVHGWSNGGEFTYDVLWQVRGNYIAGIAPASSILNNVTDKNVMPIFHVAGVNDSAVPFSSQRNGALKALTLNQCQSNGYTWATGDNNLLATKYWSPVQEHVIFTQYDGGHAYPDNVPTLIMKSFRQIANKKSA